MSKGKRGQRKTKSRKEIQEKEREKIERLGVSFTEGIWNRVFVAIGVLCFILVFYLLTLYLTSHPTSKNKVTEEAVLSYTKILAGSSFSIDDGEYLVVYYDEDNSLEDVVNTYKTKDDHLNIYTVDMSDPLNTKYVSEEANTNPSNASELKISGPTLIKFDGKTVKNYIQGTDSISDYLGQ